MYSRSLLCIYVALSLWTINANKMEEFQIYELYSLTKIFRITVTNWRGAPGEWRSLWGEPWDDVCTVVRCFPKITAVKWAHQAMAGYNCDQAKLCPLSSISGCALNDAKLISMLHRQSLDNGRPKNLTRTFWCWTCVSTLKLLSFFFFTSFECILWKLPENRRRYAADNPAKSKVEFQARNRWTIGC